MAYNPEACRLWERLLDLAYGANLNYSCDAPFNAEFSALSVALCFLKLESPFPEGNDDDCDWQDMMYFYKRWNEGGCKSNACKTKFVNLVKQIVEEHPMCPFEREPDIISLDELCEEEYKRKSRIKNAQPVYMFSIAESEEE